MTNLGDLHYPPGSCYTESLILPLVVLFYDNRI